MKDENYHSPKEGEYYDPYEEEFDRAMKRIPWKLIAAIVTAVSIGVNVYWVVKWLVKIM